MKNKLLLAVLLSFSTQAAVAMSLAAAGENLLYFEHAKLSSEHCERRGISTSTAFVSWQERNISLYREATATIWTEAGKRGISKAEQQVVFTESSEYRTKLAQEHISKKGVNCAKFDSVLQMYSELMKR